VPGPEPESAASFEPDAPPEPDPEAQPDSIASLETEPEVLEGDMAPSLQPTTAEEEEEEAEAPVPLIDLSVIGARGLKNACDCMANVRVTGQAISYRTRVSRASASPTWNETFTFSVPNPADSQLAIELFDWRQSETLCRATASILEGEQQVQTDQGIEIVIAVTIREGVPPHQSDDQLNAVATRQTGTGLDERSRTALENWRENFLRLCGKDPKEVHGGAAMQAAAFYEEEFTVVQKAKAVRVEIPDDRTLWGNRRLLAAVRPDATAGELRARIGRVQRTIDAIDAEIGELELEIANSNVEKQAGNDAERVKLG
jgi:hypothetical protein